MKKILNRRTILFSSVCLAFGIFLGRLTFLSLALSIALPLALLASGILLLFLTKNRLILVLLFVVAFGMALSDFDALRSQGAVMNNEAVISCRVKETDEKMCLVEDICIDDVQVKGKAYVYSSGRFEVGDRLTVKGKIKTYTVDVLDVGNASLYSREIYYEVRDYTILRWDKGEKTPFERVKEKLEKGMEKYLSAENAGVMKSLLFGDKKDMFETDEAVLGGIGLAHVFAVSGLHVGFLAMLLSFLLRKCRLNPYLIIGLTAFAVVLYGILTGFPAGVKRALIMYLVSSFARPLGRKNDSLTSLSLAAGIILLTNPRELFDIGFLMSVGAVMGILCFYKPLYRLMTGRVKNAFLRYACKLVATTISANTFILPVCFNVFGSITPYAVLSNLLLLPILSVTFPFAVIVAIISLLWARFAVLYYITGYVLNFVRTVATSIYLLPASTIQVNSLGWLSALYVLVAAFVSPYFLVDKKYKFGAVGVLGVAFLVFSFL